MKKILAFFPTARSLWCQENLLYLVVWGLLFAAPLLSSFVRTVSDTRLMFDWPEMFITWRRLGVFLLLFLVHNFLLAPLLVLRQRRVAYFSVVTVIVAAFVLWECSNRPNIKEDRGHQPPPHIEAPGHHRPFDKPRLHAMRPDGPPPFFGERDILTAVVLLLMFGANIGTKFYFRSLTDRKRMAELERKNLEQQLEYLRYQINPHFFMNTLNNIHALVDIDPAKAQETIVELSKMMRFVLYEGDKRGVPLTKELDFIRTYVKLMKLRYTDCVKITLNLPTEVPDRTIPPLMLISFVENAFKHGVSYQRESFIDISVTIEGGMLSFGCRNSKARTDGANGTPKQGGVGLANVRKRLDLLYGADYSLSIDDATDVYSVKLNIPLS